jgi:hypothetical protein
MNGSGKSAKSGTCETGIVHFPLVAPVSLVTQ